MSWKLSAEQERLRVLAEQQYASIRDPEVFACWHVVVEAIASRWLWPEALDDLLYELDTGGGLGAEEYYLEVTESDRVEATLINEACTCPRDEMLYELRRLRARFHGEPAPPPGPAGSGNPTDDDIRAAAALLSSLAGLGASSHDTAAGRRMREEVSAVLAGWADRPSGGEPAAALSRAVAGLSPADRAQLADALRVFADWAERPGQVAGARVDSVIEALERSLGPLLAHGRRAEEAQTQQRIASAARDSIAQRLREAGATEPDDQ